MAFQDRIAPKGAIWVCGACGKTHHDQYGIEGQGDRGWDESCAINAVLCDETSLVREGESGRVIKADPYEPSK